MAPRNLSHVAIGVRDMDTSVAFYRDVVGLEVLRAWCAERLSDYKVPETMDVRMEPLPRNANGKVMKRQLREAFIALMSRA